jgi:disulfide bond formation protein DsbB
VSTQSMQTLVGVLTVLALIATIGGLVVLAGGQRPWAAQWRADIAPVALGVVALVAAVTSLGSLYFSEIADFTPCRLCWFQRTMAYPLALITVVAAVRRDSAVRWYAWPLCIVGAATSGWHSLVEKFPQWESDTCALTTPCSVPWFRTFGVLTLAHMALVSFVCQAVWLALAQRTVRKVTDEHNTTVTT